MASVLCFSSGGGAVSMLVWFVCILWEALSDGAMKTARRNDSIHL